MEDALLIAARLVLAAVFAAAAAAKLADPGGARRAATDLGVPHRLAGTVSVALPIAELTVAALLLPASTAVAGAFAALVLLTCFSAALGVALARGRAPDCHCFGQLHASPATWRALARNGLLAGVAAFVVVAGWGDAGPTAVVALAPLAVLAAGLTVWGLRRRPERHTSETPRQPAAEAPAFELGDIHGGRISLDDLLVAGRPVLLVFVDELPPGLRSRLAELDRYESHAVTVCLVVPEASQATPELDHVLLDPEGTIRRAYGVAETPSAVLVSSYGTVASPVATGIEEIEALAERALEEEEPPPQWVEGLPLGTPMPAIALPSLTGPAVELNGLAVDDTVFLFWRPGCRPCRGLYEQVRAWERARPRGAPELVVVSIGGRKETASERFRSPVLLDPELAASEGFGVDGAPMAVRVDRERRVASPIAVGAEAVLSLLRPDTAET